MTKERRSFCAFFLCFIASAAIAFIAIGVLWDFVPRSNYRPMMSGAVALVSASLTQRLLEGPIRKLFNVK